MKFEAPAFGLVYIHTCPQLPRFPATDNYTISQRQSGTEIFTMAAYHGDSEDHEAQRGFHASISVSRLPSFTASRSN